MPERRPARETYVLAKAGGPRRRPVLHCGSCDLSAPTWNQTFHIPLVSKFPNFDSVPHTPVAAKLGEWPTMPMPPVGIAAAGVPRGAVEREMQQLECVMTVSRARDVAVKAAEPPHTRPAAHAMLPRRNTQESNHAVQTHNFAHVAVFSNITEIVMLGLRTMSTYRSYCQSQAVECTRRARLAASPEVADYHRKLALEWLKLAEKERAKARLKATQRPLTIEAVQVAATTRVLS
jgi:hypothetical protein